jgi:hypothetical protein
VFARVVRNAGYHRVRYYVYLDGAFSGADTVRGLSTMDNSENTTSTATLNAELVPDITVLAYESLDASETAPTAVNVWKQFQDLAGFAGAFFVQSRMRLYHIGKLLADYGEEHKCATREELLTSLHIDLHAHAKRINHNPDHYRLDAKHVTRCLLALKQKKTANELGVFRAWANATQDSDAQRILDAAANIPEKKTAKPKTAYERILRMVREDLHLQSSLEAVACECLAKIKDEKRLSVIRDTADYAMAVAEDRARRKTECLTTE